jgi:hypothetical protein
VLTLTARGAVPDRVAGLDAGADWYDYLTRPFALDELLARVRACGRRRSQLPDSAELVAADLKLEPQRREVSRGGYAIELTRREFDLVHNRMRNPERGLTRQQITAEVWSGSTEATANVVEVYIHDLRNKIDRDTGWPLIRLVRRIQPLADERGVAVEVDVASPPPEVDADPERLHQVADAPSTRLTVEPVEPRPCPSSKQRPRLRVAGSPLLTRSTTR